MLAADPPPIHPLCRADQAGVVFTWPTFHNGLQILTTVEASVTVAVPCLDAPCLLPMPTRFNADSELLHVELDQCFLVAGECSGSSV